MSYARTRRNVFERFPPEVMSLIFETRVGMCTPETTTSCAIQLSAVCTNWCNIVRSTPQLWTTIAIRARIIRATGESPVVVKEWISRSKSLLIDLYISSKRGNVYRLPQDAENLSMLVSMLAESSNKWRSVSFDIHSPFIHKLCTISQGLPHLRSMRYSSKCWRAMPPRKVGYLKWKEQFSPKELEIDFNLPSGSLSDVLNVRADKLTHLAVKHMDIKHCLDVIRLSPVLRSLKTAISGGSSHSLPIVRHSVLESFVIDSGSGFYSQVFSSLTLPRLRTLYLFYMQDSYSPIEDFIRRSSPPITSMRFWFIQDGDERDLQDFQTITALTPSITHLDLRFMSALDDEGNVEANVLKYLIDSGKPKSDDPSYSPPLPQLQSLSYSATSVPIGKYLWHYWDLVPALFPVSTCGSVEPSLRPLKAFSGIGFPMPTVKNIRRLVPFRKAGIDFGLRNVQIGHIAMDRNYTD
ncbi:hypothetical protein CPC08DRAFT_710040 [Agrocybe pediades]|nr:hypothetical protein CPC08DRAFT_710040 [Agrocybe pediades]